MEKYLNYFFKIDQKPAVVNTFKIKQGIQELEDVIIILYFLF